MEKENNKKKFEVKLVNNNGSIEKLIFIDDQLLDWRVDINSYMDAMKMGPMYHREIQKSIVEHFVDSVSDFLGRKVTIEEIKIAINNGWI